MLRRYLVPRTLAFSILISTLAISISSHAVSILSGPTFTPATNAPLAGTLKLTTDVDSRVSVSLADGTTNWEKNFFDYGTNHAEPLLGFQPDRTNHITVTVYDKSRNTATASAPLVFVTDPLPDSFPKLVLLKSDPARMEPGYTLFRVANNGDQVNYIGIVDSSGKVVWYSSVPTTADVRQLDNGNLFTPLKTKFVEYNMLGDTVRSLVVPADLPINQHDAVPTDHGTILYISDAHREVTNFPSSATDPNAPRKTTNVLYNKIVEVSAADGTLLHTWSLIDMLDPTRIDYLAFQLGVDVEHANAVLEDPRDNSIIVSMRHQDAVIKFTRDGQLKWILGPHKNWGTAWKPYLLAPVGNPFEWNYAQHAPMLTPQGTLLVYDDGNYRASPFDAFVPDAENYSRAVEFEINEQTMQVSQVWDYGRTNVEERLFTHAVCNTDWLPKTGNVLVNFGNVTYVNGEHPSPYSSGASMVRIKEVTHDAIPEVVFDLEMWDSSNTNSNYSGYWVYRSHRIPDLYVHPAEPVEDLQMTYQGGAPELSFSADETRTYTVEVSTNLNRWDSIGIASPGQQAGDFNFIDDKAAGAGVRYYRVMTP